MINTKRAHLTLIAECLALFSSFFLSHAVAADTNLVLPLKIGIYVDASQTCADPANAGVLSFNGVGLSGAHSHDCHMMVQTHKGSAYSYVQTCIEAGVGDAPVVSQTAIINIHDDSHFALEKGTDSTAFNYCAPSTLPAGITVPEIMTDFR